MSTTCCDEGEAYGHLLQDAAAPTVSTRYNGTIHDFGLLNALADLPTTRAMIRQVADGIRKHIGGGTADVSRSFRQTGLP